MVISELSTKKLSCVVVTTAGLAFVMFSMYAVIVDFGVQARLPVPSVSNTYPIAPPSIFTLETSPKVINPPTLPPRLVQFVPLNASTCPLATFGPSMSKLPVAPDI